MLRTVDIHFYYPSLKRKKMLHQVQLHVPIEISNGMKKNCEVWSSSEILWSKEWYLHYIRRILESMIGRKY